MADITEIHRHLTRDTHPMSDEIKQPDHYTFSDIEVIDAIEAWGLDTNMRLSNVIKYVARHARKGDPLSSLYKARQYLNREIAIREGRKGVWE